MLTKAYLASVSRKIDAHLRVLFIFALIMKQIDKNSELDLRLSYENTPHKHGIRFWGSVESFYELHELLVECWDFCDYEVNRAQECSYIGIMMYLSYEVRHAYMGGRLVKKDGVIIKKWNDDLSGQFNADNKAFQVGMELPWSQVPFVIASWWECIRRKDCPARILPVLREFTENTEILLQLRSKTQYKAIEPLLHGAIYAANPYLMFAMEYVDYKYLRSTTYRRMSLTELANLMKCAVIGTIDYGYHLDILKKQAKRLECNIEDLKMNYDDSIYDVKL